MTGEQEVAVSRLGRHAVVAMPAEIDAANAADVADQLLAPVREGAHLTIADLSGTRFCDSAGVHALVRAFQLGAASGAELRLAVGDSPVARVLQLTGLDQVMSVYHDVQLSLDSPGPGSRPQPAQPGPPGPAGLDHPAGRDVLPDIQAALLPAALPFLPTARIAASYLAAAQDQAAGGDWFDAVPLGDGSVALIVGDVASSGGSAAAAMGQLRAVLNDLLSAEPDLATLLSRADAFATRFPVLHAASLVLAVLDTSDGTLRYVTYGHPAPLVVSDAGTARFLPGTGTGPLGTGSAPVLATTVLQPGELVLLYSNGLTMRPGRTPEEALADLGKVAGDAIAERTLPAGSAPTAADRLCQLTVELLTGAGYSDDVTTLAVQWSPQPAAELHLDLPSEVGTVRAMRHSLTAWLTQLEPLLKDRDALLLAVTEIITNAVEHAYPPGQPGSVELHASVSSAGNLECRILDHGTWRIPGPGTPWRGQGLMVAAHLVDEMQVQHLPQDAAEPPGTRGTVVTLRHRLTRFPMVTTRGTDQPAAQPASPGFSVTATADHQSAHASVSGPLDLSTADRLAGHLLAACHGGILPLTVDLRQVTHLTSAAVRVLYRVRQQLNAHQKVLILITEPGSAAEAVLNLVRLPHQGEPG